MRGMLRCTKLRGARLLGRFLARTARRAEGTGPSRILIVRIDERVGNVLLTLPLVSAVVAGFEAARVDLLLAASKVDLAERSVRVLPFERRDLFRRPGRLVWRLWKLRCARYDIAIDASHWHRPSVTSAALVAWSGAPIRVGHTGPLGVGYHTHLVANPQTAESEIWTKLRLLRPLGIASPRAPEVRLSIGAREPNASRMRAWLRQHDLVPGGFIAICPGGRKADHRVGPEVFVAVAHAALARGLIPVVLWGPDERPLAERVADALPRGVCAPPTTLGELAALFALCSVAVTNDTGPMHLAVASGARTLSLFRRSSETRWRHPVARHRVVRADARSVDDVIREVVPTLDAWLGMEHSVSEG